MPVRSAVDNPAKYHRRLSSTPCSGFVPLLFGSATMSPSLTATPPDHRKESDSSKVFQHARQIILASTPSANASCTVRESRPGTACCAAQMRQ
ncbi:hypothetical protein HMPREF9614_02106 [Cutibacterium acnes HL002PA2]|nr:hypothetical protein HMPREF9593_01218 [Cutibacterium acnes HL046PA2]EFT04127.1 hypothetical protein HMPREF9614_02106 [Cutibacterium acnes HL002PA2]EFT80326.1 hypothetical protein HMPREF9602_01948 [Cutibacterium acnes HL030PA2]EGE89816.1 hypothetical protein HMPREF9568_02281 [Cutibacterium acnes HL013PA2]